MSKQSEARLAQNYVDKPLSMRCRECRNFRSEIEDKHGHSVEKRMRCAIGGFAVTPNAYCDIFERKQ